MEEMEDTMALATSTSIQPALTFGDNDTLAWPIVGNVLINYSMDKKFIGGHTSLRQRITSGYPPDGG